MNGGRRLVGSWTNHRTESRILIVFLISAALAFGLGKLASEVIEGDTFALDRSDNQKLAGRDRIRRCLSLPGGSRPR